MNEDEQQKKLPSVEDNGKRTMPDEIQARIEAWCLEGRGIIEHTDFPSLAVRQQGVFCMASKDEEIIRLILGVIQQADVIRRAKRVGEAKQKTE